MEPNKLREIENAAKRMRRNCLEMGLAAGRKATHFGGGLSIVDILATLYTAILNYDSKNPLWENRDRFLLSKGHGVIGYYAALREAGFLTDEELLSFEQNNTLLPGHPVICKEKGIEFTNGSLGMGLSIGVGQAIAAKKKNLDYKVYVLMGDGECNEGSVWEAVMAASQFKLGNLIAIIDQNQYQLGGANRDIMSVENISECFAGFGWNTFEIDGHDYTELYQTFSRIEGANCKPTVVIAKTMKGKGFSFSEGSNEWHHAVLTKSLYETGIEELGEIE